MDLGQGAIDFLRFDSDEYLRRSGCTPRAHATQSYHALSGQVHSRQHWSACHIYVGDAPGSPAGSVSGRVLMLCGHGGEDK